MQTNGCTQQNGENNVESGTPQMNGAHYIERNGQENGEPAMSFLFGRMSKNEQDLVRLIGQYLKSLGLKYVRYFW